MYQHVWFGPERSPIDLPAGKVVCVGRNYAEHAKELNNPVPTEPVLFIKPATSLVAFDGVLIIPESDCHYEAELAILIGRELKQAQSADVASAIRGYGLALDLTKRGLQAELKTKSLPWELAKGFDGACPITAFVAAEEFANQEAIQFELAINGATRQQGNTNEMLNPIMPLIAHMSQHFTLLPGDVVLTGTPKGVGALTKGLDLTLKLDQRFEFNAQT